MPIELNFIAQSRAELGTLDWGALIIYMVVMIGVGLWYSRGERTTESYLLGGRGLAWWAVGISFVVSLTSTLSLVGVPGEVYNYGLTMTLSFILGPVALLLAFYLFVRFYFKRRIFTPFEYLEDRFDSRIRIIAAGLFWLTRLTYLGLVLYSSSKIFQGAAGWNVYWTILVVGIVGVAYTVVGGIRAVVWTDLLQFVVIVVGLGVLAVIITQAMPDGVAGIFRITFEQGHGFVDQHGEYVLGNRSFYLPSLNPFHDGTDGRLNLFYDRYILVLILFNPFVFHFFVFSSDQIGLQRLLSTSSYKNAERSMYTNLIVGIPMMLVMYFVGMAVFSFYHRDGAVGAPESGDLALFRFIGTEMPSPFAGLLLAAMLAAVMSTLDSGVNSLATVLTKDFYVRMGKGVTEASQVTFAKWTTVLVGLFAVVVALTLAAISEGFFRGDQGAGEGTVDSVTTVSYVWMALESVLPGVFLLAVLSRRATANHALIAILCGWAGSGALMIAFFVSKHLSPDRTLSMMFIGHGGLVITCVVGFAVTRFAPRRPAGELADKTIWTLQPKRTDSSA